VQCALLYGIFPTLSRWLSKPSPDHRPLFIETSPLHCLCQRVQVSVGKLVCAAPWYIGIDMSLLAPVLYDINWTRDRMHAHGNCGRRGGVRDVWMPRSTEELSKYPPDLWDLLTVNWRLIAFLLFSFSFFLLYPPFAWHIVTACFSCTSECLVPTSWPAIIEGWCCMHDLSSICHVVYDDYCVQDTSIISEKAQPSWLSWTWFVRPRSHDVHIHSYIVQAHKIVSSYSWNTCQVQFVALQLWICQSTQLFIGRPTVHWSQLVNIEFYHLANSIKRSRLEAMYPRPSHWCHVVLKLDNYRLAVSRGRAINDQQLIIRPIFADSRKRQLRLQFRSSNAENSFI
jgi:hypothetical protein